MTWRRGQVAGRTLRGGDDNGGWDQKQEDMKEEISSSRTWKSGDEEGRSKLGSKKGGDIKR